MARAGRKRRDTIRRGGRIDWWAEREDPTVATKWHRARDNILAYGGDPYLVSQSGKLFVFRQLTVVQVEAAKRWSEMLSTYRRVVVGMSGNIHGSALDRVGQGLAREQDPAWIAEFCERFEAAQDAILETGKPALSAVNRLCRDEASTSVLPDAKRALAALIVHFRLEPRKGLDNTTGS
jgi:hypothetical protein